MYSLPNNKASLLGLCDDITSDHIMAMNVNFHICMQVAILCLCDAQVIIL